MKLIVLAFVFNFILNCWPKTNIDRSYPQYKPRLRFEKVELQYKWHCQTDTNMYTNRCAHVHTQTHTHTHTYRRDCFYIPFSL